MSQKLLPYEKYKDSGVEWLGQIPEGWRLCRVRFMAMLNPSRFEVDSVPRDQLVTFIPMELVGDDGSLKLESERPLKDVETGYTFFADNDVTYAKITPCFENGKGALMQGLSNGFGFGTTELTVLRPNQSVDPKYLWYMTVSREFRKIGESYMYGAGGQKRVPDDFARDFYWAQPPIPVQRTISIYLDKQTSRINALVKEQEELITLLKEKRQALISHAVTKGFDPNATMKPSGVEWIGDIPEGWEVLRVKNIFDLIVEPAPDDNSEVLLSIYTEIGVKPRSELEPKGNKATTTDGYWRVKKGDFIVNKLLAWMGAIGLSEYEGVTSPAYDILRPKRPLAGLFFHELFRSKFFSQEMKKYSRGIMDMRLRLYFEEFGSIFLPFPPLHVQIEISARILEETGRIDGLVAEAESTIALMQEHRSALISAVVTGKVQVPA